MRFSAITMAMALCAFGVFAQEGETPAPEAPVAAESSTEACSDVAESGNACESTCDVDVEESVN
jgi:hypothetical protein